MGRASSRMCCSRRAAGLRSPRPGSAVRSFKRLEHGAIGAFHPGADVEARSAAAQLLQLAAPGNPRLVRADALELLGIVGGDAEVKPLAELISDREVGEDARMALERIPGKAAEEALKAAGKTSDSSRRVAIDLSLRHRKMRRSELGTKK